MTLEVEETPKGSIKSVYYVSTVVVLESIKKLNIYIHGDNVPYARFIVSRSLLFTTVGMQRLLRIHVQFL